MLPALQPLFDQIESQKADIVRRVCALDDTALNASPKPGAWSPREIVHHIVIAENETSGQIAVAKAMSGTLRKRPFMPLKLLSAAMRAGITLPAPPMMIPQGPTPPLPELSAQWDAQRAALRERLDSLTDTATPVAVHPVFGPLDTFQLLDLADAHLTYHRKQLEHMGAR